jgi:hypothetical protein|tara:strand:- start:2022 stop:2351 length:330 start_codon:yes stop_codon:yes gene_type:complete
MSWRNIFKSESRKKRESDLINQLNDFLEKNYPVEANYAFGEFLDKLSKLDFKGENILKNKPYFTQPASIDEGGSAPNPKTWDEIFEDIQKDKLEEFIEYIRMRMEEKSQ